MYCYEQLAISIIKQACYDYRNYRKVLLKHPEDVNICRKFYECRKFFTSDWFKKLTTADGSYILRKLESEEVK